MKIPDYKNKSISEEEALELLQLLQKKFKKSKMRFLEIIATDDFEAGEPSSDWEKLFAEFQNYLKFVINITMTKGILAISFFNTKYGLYIEASWMYRTKERRNTWASISLSSAVAESMTPNSVTELVIHNLHIFGD